MSIASTNPSSFGQHWATGVAEPSGQFTVQVVGVPELRATEATRQEAVERIRAMLGDWLISGQLLPIDVPDVNPLLHFADHLNSDDPIEREFVEELARNRSEDYHRARLEDERECSASSSTPTT